MSGKNEEKLDEIMMRNDECLQTKKKSMIKSGQWKAMQNNELDEKGGEMEETGVDGETEDVDKVDEKEIENDETMDLIQEATSMEASISKVNERLDKQESQMDELIETVNKFCKASTAAYAQLNEVMIEIKDELKEIKIERQEQNNFKELVQFIREDYAKQLDKINETVNEVVQLYNAIQERDEGEIERGEREENERRGPHERNISMGER